jgi:putative ABC transport system permease protein
LKYDDHYNFEITGVAENPPSNSSIDYDFIGSISSLIVMGEVNPVFLQKSLKPEISKHLYY